MYKSGVRYLPDTSLADINLNEIYGIKRETRI